MAELWDLYTEERVFSGCTCRRGEEIPDGLYHLVVHVWIMNGRGEFLISRRSASRPAFPLFLETVGGSVLAGEDSIDGAVREAEEEVGLRLDRADGVLLSTIARPDHHDILDVFLFRYDGEISLKNASTDEVESASWRSRDEIEKLILSGEMVPTLSYFSNLSLPDL